MFDFEKVHKNSKSCIGVELNCDFLILLLNKVFMSFNNT